MPYNERAELIEVYGHNLTTLRTLLKGLPDETIKRQGTGAELWSILEVVCHLRDTEERAFNRVQQMVSEDQPFLTGYDPDSVARDSAYQSQSLEDALNAFEQTRRAQIAYLQSLPESAWQRNAIHEEVGGITVQSLTTHMVLHDSIHMAQISRKIQESGA
jgi:uncharacterized damage-inducible protein DinB